jgi:hypothetical protein
MELTLENRAGGAWRVIDPGLVLDKDSRVRFRFKANFSGYLYVMNQGTSGEYTMLFPRQDTGEANKVEAGKTYTVPATEGAFRITGPAGQDIIYWVVSPMELGSSGSTRPYLPLPPPPQPGPVPPNLIPRCDDTILRARGDCVDTTAGPRAVSQTGPVPENLSGVPRMQSRELFFIREQKAAVVSSPVPLTGPVIYEFRLAHR